MARQKKISNLKLSSNKSKWLKILSWVFLLMILFQLEFVSELIAKGLNALGIPATVQDVATVTSAIAWMCLGVSMLIVASLAAAAFPVIAGAFAIAGGVLLVTQSIRLWNYFSIDENMKVKKGSPLDTIINIFSW